MNDRPWSKWFWADWESDEGLRLCSLAAQGLWMRMLCICAKGEPRGYLAINGEPLDIEALSIAVGRPESEVAPLVEELERWGVFSRNRRGLIYSRRIVRDEKRTQEGRKHIKKRWAQPSEEQQEIPLPNRGANRGPTTQRPEARGQKEHPPNPPKGGNGAHTPRAILAQIVGDDAASAFLAHRKALRRPMTERAAELLAADLGRIKERGGEPTAALDLAIGRGWQAVKPDWYFNAVAKGEVETAQHSQRWQQMSEEEREHYRDLARQRAREREH